MKERDIQELIADYPWLLNLNYETVAELPKKGQEYVTSDQKRIDLVLRERITHRPVLVEFKAVPFYRENIGQILEYRARCLIEGTDENSLLNQIFGEILAAPKLVLVVPHSSPEARLACNLSGIDVYEYETSIKKLTDPVSQKSLRDFSGSLADNVLPITLDRHEKIEEIYQKIRDLLSGLNRGHGIKRYRYSPGIYFYPLANFFINIWLFQDNEVSIGIYENIFENEYHQTSIEFFSNNSGTLRDFREKVKASGLFEREHGQEIPEVKDNDDGESYLRFVIETADLVADTGMLRPYINAFISVYPDA